MNHKDELPCDLEVSEGQAQECPELTISDVSAAQSLVGSTIAGKFEVLSEIGSGGMSVVYKARHKLLDKIIALKILQENRLQDQKDIKRFQKEAQAASSLNHPNIVPVREYGIDENQQPYIVMDFINAVPLSKVIEEGSLTPSRALRIAADLCRGLEHAHVRGIVHRDIKPDNILLAKNTDGSDLPLILDFGIARVTRDDESRTRLTQTGEVFGTPAYMSPEQALGMPLDCRSDLYSVGCLMYEMLSGRQPFSAEYPLALLMKHVSEAPAPLGDTPAEIQSVVLKSMSKDPLARWGSAAELANAIEQIGKSTQIINIPEWCYFRTLILRLCAWVIDLVLVSFPGWIIAASLPQGFTSGANRTLSLCGLCEQCMPSFGLTNMIYNNAGAELMLSAFLICAFCYLYHAFLESSKLQGTLGKWFLGLIVTNRSLGRLSFREASYRHWSKIIYFALYFLVVGIVPKLFHLTEWAPSVAATMIILAIAAIALRKRYQLIHDVISDTRVIPGSACSGVGTHGGVGASIPVAFVGVGKCLVVGAFVGLAYFAVAFDIEQFRVMEAKEALRNRIPSSNLESVSGDHLREVLTHLENGCALGRGRKFEQANAEFQQSQVLAEKSRNKFWQGVALTMMANCENASGNYAGARELCLRADRLISENPERQVAGYTEYYKKFCRSVITDNKVKPSF